MIYFVAYPVIGLLFRLTEIFRDEKNYNKGVITGIAYGALMGYGISSNVESAFIFTGIIIGVLLAGGIDYAGHYLALSIIMFMILYLGNPIVPLIPFALVSIASFFDRKINTRGNGRFMRIVLLHPLLKIMMIAFTILNIIGLKILIAFIAFELAYVLGGVRHGKRKQDNTGFRYQR